MKLILAGFAWVLMAGAQPRLVNAKLETRAVAGNLESSFRALVAQTTAPAWVGYAVAAVPGNHNMCCYSSWDGNSGYRGCGLEPGSRITEGTPVAGPIRLEADREFHVLFRVEQKQVTRIRTFSSDCELDAGDTQVVWFTGVKPAENVALLATFIGSSETTEREEARQRESAMSGIALAADPSAGAQLVKYLGASQPELLRRKAAFWIGAAHRTESLPALSQLALQDPSDRVRESAVQGLAMSREPSAIQTVIGIAKNDKSIHVRGKALFWLAQQAGEKAAAAIQDAIENDPEIKVKEEAVFALSRLPKDQSVPALIQLARTSRIPAVKKKAMFWLGQSRDQRAIAFFAEVLSR